MSVARGTRERGDPVGSGPDGALGMRSVSASAQDVDVVRAGR
ncbi:hypothetical protein [Cellulomonas sp. P5_C5]